jgi:hypothetical protein
MKEAKKSISDCRSRIADLRNLRSKIWNLKSDTMGYISGRLETRDKTKDEGSVGYLPCLFSLRS